MFPLVVVGLLAGTHGLLVWGLGRGLYRPWMRWVALGVIIHAVVAWLPFMIYGRDARYEAPRWFNALFTLPAMAFTLSALVTVLSAPLWVAWARSMRRRSREARARRAGEAGPASATSFATPSALTASRPPLQEPAADLSLTRRNFLRIAAAAPPALLLASGPTGVFLTEVDEMPFVRRMTLSWPNLAPGLEGLKIAQVSDIHIGIFVDAPKLRRAMEVVQLERPDVFVVTGDVIDDLRQLPETMEALGHVKAPLGSFACLGNHEYYTGLRPIRAAYDRSPIRMLVNEGAQVKTASGATLEISAVDYPMGNGIGFGKTAGGGAGENRYAGHAERALVTKAPGGDFRLHLSHHPHGFDEAALRGADLTLSGHTHGGQIAIGGRPLFGAFFKYMRGLYATGERKLFVHSGLGHWMPLRIGCPAEIAVITLRKGNAALAEAEAA